MCTVIMNISKIDACSISDLFFHCCLTTFRHDSHKNAFNKKKDEPFRVICVNQKTLIEFFSVFFSPSFGAFSLLTNHKEKIWHRPSATYH